MSSTPDSLSRLQDKIAELRGRSHLPEAMVAIAALVAELHLEALPKVRFTERRDLPADVAAAVAPPDLHAQGRPLLPGEKFPLDLALAEELVHILLRRVPEVAPELAPPAKALAEELAGDARAAVASAVLPDIETDASYSAWEQAHPEAPGFFRFIVQNAALPSIVVASRLLSQISPFAESAEVSQGATRRDEKLWSHGHCPLCGRPVLMGRLVENEGLRLHSCSFCAAEWRAPRIGCPFCLAASPGDSRYYSCEEEPGYLIDVCDHCHCYCKLADFRALDRIWLPALDDLSSITLDLRARQMGYQRPTLSFWGF